MDFSTSLYEVNTNPTANENFTVGFAVFDRWANLLTEEEFVCLGDGIWKNTTSSTGGVSTNAIAGGRVSSTGVPLSSLNFTVTVLGTGYYRMNLDVDLGTFEYPVIVTPVITAPTNDVMYHVENTTSISFDVRFTTQDDGGGTGTPVNTEFSFYIPNIFNTSVPSFVGQSVTTATDVTSAGSGQIITSEERQILKGAITGFNSTGVTLEDNNSPLPVPLTNLIGVNTLGYNILSGGLTIPISGWYTVAAQCNGTGDNRRNNHTLNVVRNGVNIQGMSGADYSRNNNNNDYSASISTRFPTFPFAQGDIITLQLVWAGDNNAEMITKPQETWLHLEFKGN